MTRREINKLSQKKWYIKNKDKARQNVRDRRVERRLWFNEMLLKLSCIDCGENHPGCLDFHHRDPATKVAEVSWLLGSLKSKGSIIAEIEKCNVLCANCHRKLHYEEKLNS